MAAPQRDAPPRQRRWQVKWTRLALTFPQNDTDPDDCMDLIEAKFAENLDWAVVGQEKHQDGHNHLHCAIFLKQEYRSSVAADLDVLGGGLHGNYQSMRDEYKWVAYCMKGENYVSAHVDVEVWLQAKLDKQSGKATLIARQIQRGATVDSVALEHPGFFMMNSPKLYGYSSYVQALQARKSVLPWNGAVTPQLDGPLHEVSEWLNLNVCQPRGIKQRNLWLWSATPDHGKTTFLDALSHHCRVYHISTENFYDQYFDDQFDVAVMDEFRGSKQVAFINQWCDGTQMPIPKKGSQYTKFQNIPTIICGNHSIWDSWTTVDALKLATVQSRFLEVELTDFLEVQFT